MAGVSGLDGWHEALGRAPAVRGAVVRAGEARKRGRGSNRIEDAEGLTSCGPINCFTFETAFDTPLPRYTAGSLSRSSCASFSPVDAPLGTAARKVCLSAVTSHSTVGLPRESRIIRAVTAVIGAMMLLATSSPSVVRSPSSLPLSRYRNNNRRQPTFLLPLALPSPPALMGPFFEAVWNQRELERKGEERRDEGQWGRGAGVGILKGKRTHTRTIRQVRG